jgi:hypothetical protein
MEPTVQVALIGGGFGMITLAVTELRTWRQNRQISQIKHQVQNSHETNLRDDVDRVLAGVETLVEGQRQHSQEISGLREEVRTERLERIDVERRLDDHVRSLTRLAKEEGQ